MGFSNFNKLGIGARGPKAVELFGVAEKHYTRWKNQEINLVELAKLRSD